MFGQLLISTMRYLWSSLAAAMRNRGELRERARNAEDVRLKEARGLVLLREWLSEEQRKQFDMSKSFDVFGCDSLKRYRIRHGTGANVHELDDEGRPIRGLCFVPAGNLVPGDVMLAQKIALETSESSALAIANYFPVQTRDRGHPFQLVVRAH